MRFLLLIALAIVTISCPALAQYGSSGYGNPALRISESPPFTHADLRIMDSILGLTPAQRELTDALHSEFFDRYRDEATAVRLEVEALVEEAAITQKQDPLHEGTNKVTLWNKRVEEMRAQFVDDLRLLMDKNQIQLWHKVERELRRKDQIGGGRIAGESIDLIRLVDAHIDGWADDPELVAELERYADHIDRAIVARKRFLDSEETDGFYAMQQDDPERALALLKESLDLRKRVLELNTQTLDRLRAHLSAETHDDLADAFYEQSIERAIPASPLAQRIDAARALPNLTSDQRARIAEVLTRYDETSLDTKRGLFEALSQTQMDILPAMLHEEIERRAAGEEHVTHESLKQPQPLLDEAMAARLERERAAWNAVKPILSRDQLAELPKLDMETVWFPQINWFGL